MALRDEKSRNFNEEEAQKYNLSMSAINSKIEKENTEHNRYLAEERKKDLRSMIEYNRQFGGFEEKKLAIVQQYEEQIDEAIQGGDSYKAAELIQKRDAELKSEVLTGLILMLAALLILHGYPTSPVAPVFVGLGVGVIGSRFLLFFIMLIVGLFRKNFERVPLMLVSLGMGLSAVLYIFAILWFCAWNTMELAYEYLGPVVLIINVLQVLGVSLLVTEVMRVAGRVKEQ